MHSVVLIIFMIFKGANLTLWRGIGWKVLSLTRRTLSNEKLPSWLVFKHLQHTVVWALQWISISSLWHFACLFLWARLVLFRHPQNNCKRSALGLGPACRHAREPFTHPGEARGVSYQFASSASTLSPISSLEELSFVYASQQPFVRFFVCTKLNT